MKQPVLRSFFYPYIPAMINYLERWLSEKASDGWRLEAVHGWSFVFRKCSPYTAKFISYSGFGTNMGISNDYFALIKRYSRRKATINKPDSAICEVDIQKIDLDYTYFVSLRNKFYLKHYLAMLLFALVYTSLAIGLMLMNSDLAVFSLFGMALLVYSSFSVGILTYEVKHNSTSRNNSS